MPVYYFETHEQKNALHNGKEVDTPHLLTTIMCLHAFDAVVPVIRNCSNYNVVRKLTQPICLQR
jgi:hypothetical protein